MKIEIKNAPSSEIDWSKSYQLVQSEDTIVMVSSTSLKTGKINNSRDHFSGIDISNMFYTDLWLKYAFKPFNGEITLKND